MEDYKKFYQKVQSHLMVANSRAYINREKEVELITKYKQNKNKNHDLN